MRRKIAALLLILLVLFMNLDSLESEDYEHDGAPLVSEGLPVLVIRPPTVTPPPTPTVGPQPTPTLRPTSVPYQNGYFSQYHKGPTDGTMSYRLRVGDITQEQLDQSAGVIALESCDHIGKTVWIRVDGRANNQWMPVAVFDCSGHVETTQWMIESNILGEIGYYLARDLGIENQTGVTGSLSFLSPY